MNRYLFAVYRVVVPKPVRTALLKRSLRKSILTHYGKVPSGDLSAEQAEIIKYLETNPLAIFPYPFNLEYKPEDIEVSYDEVKGMSYVMLEGKQLYFKKQWKSKRIKKGFSDLLREQDSYSPHRYLTPDFDVSPDEVIADIGAAEGNFSLSVIDRVRKTYLFEYNRDWARALSTTFAPYGSKAEVINKMVSGKDDESNVRLDTFLKEHPDVTFLKIDVDGAEKEVMGSCMEILKSPRPLKIAFCTYHSAADEEVYTALLRDCGFRVSPSRGYMIPFYDKKIKAPWLRRGLIRAVKIS
jgi:hypothetical protein